jgi:hypothetical protein
MLSFIEDKRQFRSFSLWNNVDNKASSPTPFSQDQNTKGKANNNENVDFINQKLILCEPLPYERKDEKIFHTLLMWIATLTLLWTTTLTKIIFLLIREQEEKVSLNIFFFSQASLL